MAAGRRQRLSSAETRERLIEAGLGALAEHGMSIGLDAVNLEQAVRDADVSRSSAYAVWSTDEEYAPQQMFQMAVLRQAVEGRRETIAELQAIVNAAIEGFDGRRPTFEEMRELTRFGTEQNTASVAASHSWQMVMALRAILHSAPEEGQDRELADWMNESEEAVRIETIESIYKPLAKLFGFRPRPEYGEDAWHYGEIVAASISEGLAIRLPMRAGKYLSGLAHPGVENSEGQWTLFSIMFEQMVFTFFEPDDGSEWPVLPLNSAPREDA